MSTIKIFPIIVVFIFVLACSSTPNQSNGKLENDRTSRRVLGTVSLIIAPTVLASAPQPPIEITLVTKADRNGRMQSHEVRDPAPVWSHSYGRPATTLHNFSLKLDPGGYQVIGLRLSGESLGPKPFFVPFPGPFLTVPGEAECVYVGRINYSFIRLPPGTIEQAQSVVKIMADRMNKPIALLYLPKGALVPLEFSINLPEPSEIGNSELQSSYSFYKKAIERGCQRKLISF